MANADFHKNSQAAKAAAYGETNFAGKAILQPRKAETKKNRTIKNYSLWGSIILSIRIPKQLTSN
jgi:hypothetical protein